LIFTLNLCDDVNKLDDEICIRKKNKKWYNKNKFGAMIKSNGEDMQHIGADEKIA